MKHTPGPWLIEEKRDDLKTLDGAKYYTVEYIIRSVFQTPAQYIARVNCKEDAVAIAAAPDLLEALKSIENDDASIPPRIWMMRNEAIAKAEPAR